MSAAAVLLALLGPLLGEGAAPGQDLAPSARAQAVLEIRGDPARSAVELGEPVEVLLTVNHAVGDRPAIDTAALEDDPSWALLESGERITLPDPEREGQAITRMGWTLAAMTPGKLELPAPAITLPAAEGAAEPVAVAPVSLEVQGVLALGEDAPRPISGFLGLAPQAPASSPWIPVLAGLLLAGVGACVWQVARRRRRVVVSVAGPAPLQRLAALEEGELSTPEAVRAAHFELTRALRAHLDGGRPAVHEGLTDEEWLARISDRFEPERARKLRALLGACSAVKYGAELPTHWMVRERIVAARELAAALAPAHGEKAA